MTAQTRQAATPRPSSVSNEDRRSSVPLSTVDADAKRERKRAYMAEYHALHRVEAAAKYKKYFLRNRERLYRQQRKRYAEHSAAAKAKSALYRSAHIDRYRRRDRERYAANRECFIDKVRQWRKKNPSSYLDSNAKRRATIRGVLVETVRRTEVYDRDRGRCHLCGRTVPRKRWHLDHLIPLAKGGEHSYKNVAVACPRCNMRKGAGRLPSQLRLFG